MFSVVSVCPPVGVRNVHVVEWSLCDRSHGLTTWTLRTPFPLPLGHLEPPSPDLAKVVHLGNPLRTCLNLFTYGPPALPIPKWVVGLRVKGLLVIFCTYWFNSNFYSEITGWMHANNTMNILVFRHVEMRE